MLLIFPSCIQLGTDCENGVTQIRKPRSGFHFITIDEQIPSRQSWTQGQALESKYWFPCLDHPRVRFTTEIIVSP